MAAVRIPFVEIKYGRWDEPPACGDNGPHRFHHHVTMDIHFKEHRVWCEGLCPWCFPFGRGGRGPHGEGEHK